MTEDTRKFVEEKTKEILNAGSCCPELKRWQKNGWQQKKLQMKRP